MKEHITTIMRGVVITVACLLVIPLSACAPKTHSVLKEIEIGKYIAAVPIYDAAKIPGKHSYLALITADGHSKIIRLNTMFYNQPVWTHAGVQFIDNKSNYFIAKNSTQTRMTNHNKTDFQYGSTFYDDNTMITVLSRGLEHKKDGIIGVSKTNGQFKEFAYSTAQAHSLSNLATCQQSTYTIDLSRDIENPELVISKIFDGKSPQFTIEDKVRPNVNTFDGELLTLFENHPTANNQSNIGTAFCQNGKLSTFVAVTANQTEQRLGSVMLFQWDTNTKQSRFIPLKDEKTGDYLTTSQATIWGKYSTDEYAASKTETLVMSGLSGEILAVNTETGIAQQFTSPIIKYNDQFETDFYGRLVMRTTTDYVYAFALYENDKTGTKSFINVYSRDDGSLIKTIHLDSALNKKVYNTNFRGGYPAVSPDYTWR